MLISPHEQERLLIHVAGGLARERRARGLLLNYPEAVAVITAAKYTICPAIARALVPIADVSGRGKAGMINNDALPDIRVEPDRFTVRIDGEVIEEAPAAELPMAQRYFLS